MKETTHKTGTSTAVYNARASKTRKWGPIHCTVCDQRIWFEPIQVTEAEEAPEPRQSWLLCKHCYRALLEEMRRSPVKSPLRLRVAMGIVAAERWPKAYPTELQAYLSDRRWFFFIAASFFLFMILHLVIIVLLPLLAH
uniref:Uncharacterized protein n=1 Tax=Thermosporothrix sp. COM3 TaxID=2490863 RepID=A0A455SPR8_9CHLR|nr:hypothetical protein KTC_51740 [Thermosporothrix sp. COM3]